MKKYLWLCFVFSFAFAKAQSEPNTLNFKLLRQYDSISITEPQNLYQNLKSISLGNNSSLSLGGSYRFQTEAFINEQFDKNQDQTDYWFLNRMMLHAYLKLGRNFEFFGELNSSLISSKMAITPVDKDELSINQLFARYQFNDKWNLLVGRQNMRLGSGRLVDVREGPNVRLSFDMAQLQFKNQKTEIKGFYALPVKQQEGVFDNETFEKDESLLALYWTQNWINKTNTDLYVLHKEKYNKTWNTGTAKDKRTSIGMRHYGSWQGFKYNNEFVYQIGSFGNENIIAWTVSFNVERQFNTAHPFTIGIKTEAISGDESTNDNTLNTFDALYPRGAYFGRVARFGPSNLIDIHPYYQTKIGKINLELDYVAFWRFSTNDGIYNPALLLDYPSTNNERFIGNQIGGITGYALNKFINLELESNIIFPGSFLKQRNQGDTLYHFVFTTEIKF
ncbi:alginate export family protein [Kordia jejudonensis]|uniref:alginate export family protein n=1 Tax=Kordia jejudonensis TaxID=1348245 RepID=UPI0009E53B50|nr:porin [Kordia jejudonensis]